MKRRNIIIACVIALAVLASAIGITLAYLTDSDSVTNTFTVGDLQVTLTEPNWEDGDGDGEIPGDTLVKDPTVLAEENDSYVRFVVRFIDSASGDVITNNARANKIMQTIRFDSTYNTANATPGTGITADESYSLSDLTGIPNVNPEFTLDSEISSAGVKYYNYSSVLEEGDKATLFTNVVIPTDWGREDLEILGAYEIEVCVQAIQAANFENAAAAFSALNDATGTEIVPD